MNLDHKQVAAIVAAAIKPLQQEVNELKVQLARAHIPVAERPASVAASPTPRKKPPQEQSIAEWLADYDAAPGPVLPNRRH